MVGITKPLNLRVDHDLWLAVNKETMDTIGWTPKKPELDNGYIKKGTILMFDHIVYLRREESLPYDKYIVTTEITDKYALEFIMVYPGSEFVLYMPEFNKEEIDILIDAGVLRILEELDMREMSIAPAGILIQGPKATTFNLPVFVFNDIYVVIGPEDAKRSKGKVRTGEKMSLNHIIDVYTTAIGQNLVVK